VGIEANRDVCRNTWRTAIGLVTALVPVIGYEKSAAIAKEALENRRQRLPPGAGKRLADQGKAGRHAAAGEYDRPAGNTQIKVSFNVTGDLAASVVMNRLLKNIDKP
jgi:hypothetical protein